MIVARSAWNDAWRRQKSAAFDLSANSTARRVVKFELWGRPVSVYANANLSIYSAQPCNAACPFCVEELRPASRGVELLNQKRREPDDQRYFARLQEVLEALRPLQPTVSITGGEPSIDPRLPGILRTIAHRTDRKRTLTTNGSGLFDEREGLRVIDWIAAAHIEHLNISIAHPQTEQNGRLMRLAQPLTTAQLREAVRLAGLAGVRVRLSCVLLRSGISSLSDILGYLEFAESVGVDNVIFRQLMKTNPRTHLANSVVRYGDRQRISLEPLLDEISRTDSFVPVRQIMGYYYYVEVWRYRGMDVVFEEADLAQLEAAKHRDPQTIHELVFHPNGALASTWQPWDGILGPEAETSAIRSQLAE